MASKSWRIKIADKEYEIGMNRNHWIVNGVEYPKKECLSFCKYGIFCEYKLPIKETEVFMAVGNKGWSPVINGQFFFSGKPYYRMENPPIWAWGFVALNLFMVFLIGGIIGISLGFAGAFLVIAVCGNPANSTLKKIIASIFITGWMCGGAFLLSKFFLWVIDAIA